MVEAAGFEPATSGVRFQRSPSELRPHETASAIITVFSRDGNPALLCFGAVGEHAGNAAQLGEGRYRP